MTAPWDPITVARRYIGVKEDPPDSNHQRFGVWYGMDYVAWCAIFASYCLYTAGYRFADATTTKGFSYCPSIVDWGRRHNRLSRTPHLGDFALAVNNGLAHHVELVSVPGSGEFTSIGGNTGPANLSNGGEVVEHSHGTDGWVFVTPFYNDKAHSAHGAPVSGDGIKHSPIARNISLTSPYETGNDVKWAEEKLAGLGYPISKADGIYGPQAHNAVLAFQRKVGLPADGVLGPMTGDHLVTGR